MNHYKIQILQTLNPDKMTQLKAIQYFEYFRGVEPLINEDIESEICMIYFRMRSQTNKKLKDLSEWLDDKFRHLQLKTDMQIDSNKLECTGRIRIK